LWRTCRRDYKKKKPRKKKVVNENQIVPEKKGPLFKGLRKGFLLPKRTAETLDPIRGETPILQSKKKRKEVEEESEPSSPKMETNRCQKCNVKVGLVAIRCRCGHVYCGLHRYAEDHDCSYDYKKNEREELRANNPKITGEKIVRF